MIEDKLKTRFQEDLPLARESFSLVHKIKINHRFYLEKLSDAAVQLKQDYQIVWED